MLIVFNPFLETVCHRHVPWLFFDLKKKSEHGWRPLMHLKLQGRIIHQLPTDIRQFISESWPVCIQLYTWVKRFHVYTCSGYLHNTRQMIICNNTSPPYCYIDLFFVCLALPNHPILMSDYWDSWIPQGPRSSLWLFLRLWIDRICWYFRPCRWYRLPSPHQMVADQPRRLWISRCNKHFQLRCVKH